MSFSLANFRPDRMRDIDLLTEIATLGFVSGSESSRQALERISAFKIGYELYQRLSTEDPRIVVLRAKTINNVAEYVKKNPRASQKDLETMLQKEFREFALQVAQLG